MEGEITVVIPGEETPPEPAPVVVVTETPAANTGTDPAAILSMEMLNAQLTEARQEIGSLKARVDFLSEWQSAQGQRISELEEVEEVEEVEEAEPEPLVAEVIPETPSESSPEPASEAPRERKRKFI